MEHERLREFLYRNRLKSNDLVEFWGVTKGVVSQMINGNTKLPTKRLEELLNNPYGWDTSMLTEENNQASLKNNMTPNLSDMEIILRDMLAEKEAKIDTLNELIWKLKEENGRLNEQVKHLLNEKGKTASDANNQIANVG